MKLKCGKAYRNIYYQCITKFFYCPARNEFVLFCFTESSQTIHRVPSDYDFPPPVPQPKASHSKPHSSKHAPLPPADPKTG